MTQPVPATLNPTNTRRAFLFTLTFWFRVFRLLRIRPAHWGTKT